MPRVKVEYRSASKETYNDFCKKHKNTKLTYEEWKKIIYTFNESFRDHILETGEKSKLPYGFGDFSINKKKRKKTKGLNDEFINLPIDWKKTKEKGKRIYNFNYHTEGFFFGWQWFKSTARFRHFELWYFKPSRVTSRLITQYINKDVKYQNIYQQWLK